MSVRQIWASYWKVPVVGLLAAMLAFMGSFLLSPTYEAKTHLLVRARDASFLTANGTSLADTPGVIDSDLAKALSDTQAALASTDTVARMVVNDLHLDRKQPKPGGVVATLRRAVSTVYKHAKAFVLYGGYKSPPRYQAAVASVNNGLSGAQMNNSFVLELSAKANGPKLAAAIADSAATALITVSNNRLREDQKSYSELLRTQLDAAKKQQAAAAKAVGDFEQAHGISDIQSQLALSAQAYAQLQARLQDADAQLKSAQAQLASIDQSLNGTPSQVSTSQQITTGRSSTTVDNTGTNSVYQSLQSQRAAMQARVDGARAERDALQYALDHTSSGSPLTGDQAQLQQLELEQQVSGQTVQSLTTQYQQAQLRNTTNTVELTHVDEAAVPTYPVSPHRYMFLLVGLVIGLVVGFVASQLKVIRSRSTTPPSVPERSGSAGHVTRRPAFIDLVDIPAQQQRPSSTPTGGVTLTDELLGSRGDSRDGDGPRRGQSSTSPPEASS